MEIATLPSPRCAGMAFFPAMLGDFELSIVSGFSACFEFEFFLMRLFAWCDCAGHQLYLLIFQNAFSVAFPAAFPQVVVAAAVAVGRSTLVQVDSETTAIAGKLD